MSDSDSSPLHKKQRCVAGSMAGRGKRAGDRRNSMEGVKDIKDILDALEGLRSDFTSQLTEINKKLDKVEDLGNKVQVMEKTMNVWERRFKQLEVEEKRKWIVIKGMWKQDDVTQFESRVQLAASLEDLKQLLGIKTPFMEYYRLKDLKRNNNTFPGLVKVKFVTSDEKDHFFSRVAAAGNLEDLKGLSFQQDIPSFLVEDFKRLDGQAFRLRKSEKLKTRVVIRNLGLVLQSRARTEGSKWTSVAPERQQQQQQQQRGGPSGSTTQSGSNWTED